MAGVEAIRFGTDGWRAVISEEFTFDNLRRVAQAYAGLLRSAARGELPVPPPGLADPARGVVIGYDTRFLSERYAEATAEVLAAHGIPVALADRPTPTPVTTYAVRARGAAGAVMITASHNPAEYSGFKIKAAYAGSALPELTDAVEARLRADAAAGVEPRRLPLPEAEARGLVERLDPAPPYLARVRELVDLERIGRSGFRVVADAMHGAGAGYLAGLLRPAGVEVAEIRADRNPLFPGIAPEPIPRNLGALFEAVRAHGAHVGLVTDGDADRVGAVDGRGRFVDAQRVFALLLYHLVEHRGWQGSVVKTFAVTDMVDKLARRYGLRLHTRPVGFKYVCELALQEEVLIGGEESGGLGMSRWMPDRDGILCCLLLLELMACEGRPLEQVLEGIFERIGPHVYDRVDLRLEEAAKERLLAALGEGRVPDVWAGLPVYEQEPLDGLKLRLGSAAEPLGWLLIRPSGTEPVVRVYAEAPDEAILRRVLAEAVAFARGGGAV